MIEELNIFSNKIEEKNPKLRIISDLHEKNSLVASELVSFGVGVEFQHLKVADYIIGNIAIERKTCSDFLSSMINKRLLRQLEELKQYEKKILVIEGIEEQELYNDESTGENAKGINGNAVRGMILHILLKSGVPILFTKDYKDTARFLFRIAKRMEKEKIPFSLRAKKKSLNKKEQIQYILEGFPGIGPATAKKLLKHFKTIKNIINADIENLKKVIGKKADIFKIVEQDY